MEIYGSVKLKGTLASGTGDPLLTKDATTDEVGETANALGTLQSAHIFVGNASNVPTDVAVTGDISITNAGVTSIGSGVIVNADINASAAIAYSKLNLTGAVVNADISASAAIAYSKLNLTGAILNADINASAAIARSKMANGNIYRLVINNGTGVMDENSLITGNRAVVSDANGLPTHSATSATQIGYLSTATSNIQTQLNAKLEPIITSPAQGDILYYNGTNYVNLARGTNGQALYSTASSIQWDTPTINGIPTGGTTGQALVKLTGTDFDADWATLTVASIPEITATAAELNILDGATLTVTELNYVDGVTSPIQTQIDGKQGSSLAQNAIWVGNSSGLAAQVAGGTNGYVLTSVGGTPTWQPVSAGTPPGSDTQVIFNDGGAFGADAGIIYNKTNDALTIGTVRIHSTGTDNTFVGGSSGNFTTSGSDNVGVGVGSLQSLTIGTRNTVVGVGAGDSITSAQNNTLIGYAAGTAISSNPGYNVAVGYTSLASSTGGLACVAIGRSALGAATGNNNTAVGYQAGDNITTGTNNLILGYDVDAQSATANGQLSIQNIIFGVNNSGTGTTVSTGSIGIGEPAPTRKLEVAGSLAVKAGTSTGQIARVGGTINSSVTTTGNVGTGEDTIYSYTVPANVLSTNKDTLVGSIVGTLAANTNNKRFRLKFGATTIMDENLSFGGASAGRFDIEFRIVRTGAATQKCFAALRTNTTGNTFFNYYTTAAETLSGTVVLTLTGEATSDNDIVGEIWNVEWQPAE